MHIGIRHTLVAIAGNRGIGRRADKKKERGAREERRWRRRRRRRRKRKRKRKRDS